MICSSSYNDEFGYDPSQIPHGQTALVLEGSCDWDFPKHVAESKPLFTMEQPSLISVIVPVYNARKHLGRCLDALLASSYRSYEVIVVDDASTDDSAEICRSKDVRLLQLPVQSGPAAARNSGAQKAHGEILFFVDADVLVQPKTVARVAAVFLENPDIAAVFGSYDNDPAEKNFLSQYKNLQHHFVHQVSNPEASTFFAGCGAVRQKVFSAVGGFDEERYVKPAIEDIEMGYRMRRSGYRILLDKQLQVKHLKRWKLGSLLRADIFYRAVPWSKLILETREMVNDLNLQTSDRVCAGLVGSSLVLLTLSVFVPHLLYAVPLLLITVILLNNELYRFFFKQRGLTFAALTFPLQVLYYLYSGTAFGLCWCHYSLSGKRFSAQRKEQITEPATCHFEEPDEALSYATTHWPFD